jgi:hypothetical protein
LERRPRSPAGPCRAGLFRKITLSYDSHLWPRLVCFSHLFGLGSDFPPLRPEFARALDNGLCAQKNGIVGHSGGTLPVPTRRGIHLPKPRTHGEARSRRSGGSQSCAPTKVRARWGASLSRVNGASPCALPLMVTGTTKPKTIEDGKRQLSASLARMSAESPLLIPSIWRSVASSLTIMVSQLCVVGHLRLSAVAGAIITGGSSTHPMVRSGCAQALGEFRDSGSHYSGSSDSGSFWPH